MKIKGIRSPYPGRRWEYNGRWFMPRKGSGLINWDWCGTVRLERDVETPYVWTAYFIGAETFVLYGRGRSVTKALTELGARCRSHNHTELADWLQGKPIHNGQP